MHFKNESERENIRMADINNTRWTTERIAITSKVKLLKANCKGNRAKYNDSRSKNLLILFMKQCSRTSYNAIDHNIKLLISVLINYTETVR